METLEEDLVRRARRFATTAHKRIDHRRRYTWQPYAVHLKSVAEIVSSVSPDPALVAAAWLHDTVEDTPATHYDIEGEFGKEVSSLVYELTDVSRPSDGNRATRKAIDRAHLAQASPRAQTIKLADLIDNCRDICRHDPRFARVYMAEMSALLEVLTEGDSTLYRRARRELTRCAERLGLQHPPGPGSAQELSPPINAGFHQGRLRRLFLEGFTANDIAEPLCSFDADTATGEVVEALRAHGLAVAGVRERGFVTGYALLAELEAAPEGRCGSRARGYSYDQLVAGEGSLSDVILVLSRHAQCFVNTLDGVGGLIVRADIEKPVVRMWLFGMITMIEIYFVNRINELWPEEAWCVQVPQGRMQRAQELRQERLRRQQHASLIDCLQLSDKARIVIEDRHELEELGFKSKSEAERTIRDLESLRNNLAHAQSISTYDWPQIVRMTHRIEEVVNLL